MLQSGDLPAGWTGAPYKDDPRAKAMNAQFSTCLGIRNTQLDQVADVHSQTFSMSRASIDSEAASYRSATDLAIDRAALSMPSYSSCVAKLLRATLQSAMPPGTTIGGITATVTLGSNGGPANVIGAVAVTVTVMNSGVGVPVYERIALAAGPLIEAQVDVSQVGQPVPADLETKMINLVATRAARG